VPSLLTSDEEGHDSHSGFCAAADGGLVRGLTGTTKSTWITRMLPGNLSVQWRESRAPSVGDVLLCEVLSTGLHGRVETAVGARSKLFPGDRIACVVGNRYATSLLEGVGEISGEHADLLSASGVCGRVLARSDKAARPTSLRVLGQGEVDGQPLRLRDHVSPTALAGLGGVVWFVVVGSAMDSGKTTACASLINGLVGAGYRVGAAKLTGTASARDVGSFRDAGAQPVVDFLDEGWPFNWPAPVSRSAYSRSPTESCRPTPTSSSGPCPTCSAMPRSSSPPERAWRRWRASSGSRPWVVRSLRSAAC
jgi:hypothetical protein